MAVFTKVCISCGEDLPVSEFYKNGTLPSGRQLYHPRCKPCHSVYRKPLEMKYKYGLTPEMYDELYESQGGVCAVCGKSGKLWVDHDHNTDAVRSLLCPGCNTALGMVNDDVEHLQKLIDYIERHR